MSRHNAHNAHNAMASDAKRPGQPRALVSSVLGGGEVPLSSRTTLGATIALEYLRVHLVEHLAACCRLFEPA